MIINCWVSNQLKHVCKRADGASSALLVFCGNDSWITAGITDAGFGPRLRVRGETPARRPERFSRICPNTSPHLLQRYAEHTRLILETRHNLRNIIQCGSLMNTSHRSWLCSVLEIKHLYELYLMYTNVSRISVTFRTLDSCSRVKSHTTCPLPSLTRVLETLLSQSPT